MLLAGQFVGEHRGYRIIQVLELADGGRLLVDRGWIPAEDYELTLATAVLPEGPAAVQGHLAPLDGAPDHPPVPTREGHPLLWVPPAWAAMVQAAGPKVVPIVLRAGDPVSGGPDPAPGQVVTPGFDPYPKRIGHLEYATFWFSAAGLLLWAWILLGLRRGRPDHSPS